MQVRYVWDAKKAAGNNKKHGVTFEEAVSAFADPLGIVVDDDTHGRPDPSGGSMKKASKRTKHVEPSKASLEEIPEIDVANARVRRNHHAARIASEGIIVQVGRGRPKKLAEVGGTSPRSVRFPDAIWKVIETRAKKKGITLHAALREAILAWIKDAA